MNETENESDATDENGGVGVTSDYKIHEVDPDVVDFIARRKQIEYKYAKPHLPEDHLEWPERELRSAVRGVLLNRLSKLNLLAMQGEIRFARELTTFDRSIDRYNDDVDADAGRGDSDK